MLDSVAPYINAGVAVVVVVGAILLFRGISRAGEKLAADQRAREQRAIAARATVVAIEQSGTQSRNAIATMKLRLRLDDGRELWGFWEVEMAHVPAVQPGKAMTVKIDADDPNVCFPTIPGAQHSLLVERMDQQRS